MLSCSGESADNQTAVEKQTMLELSADTASGGREAEVTRVKAELTRRFSGAGGSIARASAFAALFPGVAPALVEEALHRLWEDGLVESYCLSDGALAFHFPLR